MCDQWPSKRRDFGLKRSCKKGGLAHFLSDQTQQRHLSIKNIPAGSSMTPKNDSEETANTCQKKLLNKAGKKTIAKMGLHVEMMKPQSQQLQRKLDKYILDEKKMLRSPGASLCLLSCRCSPQDSSSLTICDASRVMPRTGRP